MVHINKNLYRKTSYDLGKTMWTQFRTNDFQNEIRASFMWHLIRWQRKSLASVLRCRSYLPWKERTERTERMINDGFARLVRATFRLFETKLFGSIYSSVYVCAGMYAVSKFRFRSATTCSHSHNVPRILLLFASRGALKSSEQQRRTKRFQKL